MGGPNYSTSGARANLGCSRASLPQPGAEQTQKGRWPGGIHAEAGACLALPPLDSTCAMPHESSRLPCVADIPQRALAMSFSVLSCSDLCHNLLAGSPATTSLLACAVTVLGVVYRGAHVAFLVCSSCLPYTVSQEPALASLGGGGADRHAGGHPGPPVHDVEADKLAALGSSRQGSADRAASHDSDARIALVSPGHPANRPDEELAEFAELQDSSGKTEVTNPRITGCVHCRSWRGGADNMHLGSAKVLGCVP